MHKKLISTPTPSMIGIVTFYIRTLIPDFSLSQLSTHLKSELTKLNQLPRISENILTLFQPLHLILTSNSNPLDRLNSLFIKGKTIFNEQDINTIFSIAKNHYSSESKNESIIIAPNKDGDYCLFKNKLLIFELSDLKGKILITEESNNNIWFQLTLNHITKEHETTLLMLNFHSKKNALTCDYLDNENTIRTFGFYTDKGQEKDIVATKEHLIPFDYIFDQNLSYKNVGKPICNLVSRVTKLGADDCYSPVKRKNFLEIKHDHENNHICTIHQLGKSDIVGLSYYEESNTFPNTYLGLDRPGSTQTVRGIFNLATSLTKPLKTLKPSLYSTS